MKLVAALNALSAGSAVIAAIYWWRSAGVEVPGATYEKPDTNRMHFAFRRSVKLNRTAATWAAGAALLQAATSLLP